ncbi:MAG: hypothetical protein JRI23_32130 [Deltaproteobacteria bacterium]|jgi:hypothetical protein|nr:hypothetical protein [Deltaproteobacteria bacterium]MBW2536882.1 hypothetical protein [Deltaproteobacteria bacterium]
MTETAARVRRTACGLLGVLALVAACSGTAVIDGSGGATASTGTGGGTTSSSGGGATTAATTTSTGAADAGSPSLAEACSGACDFFEECSPQQKACLARCLAGASAECLAQYLDLLECVGGEIEACSWTPTCATELAAWIDCDLSDAPCGSELCSGDGSSCQCEATCGSLDHQVLCGALSEMPMCSCWVEGIYLGSCVPTTASACTVLGAGCCASLFP